MLHWTCPCAGGHSARDPEEYPLSTQTPSPSSPAATPKTAPAKALLDLVLTSLDDDKAEDVVSIDLRGRSSMADHMVIASGRNARQVAAMAEKLADRVKQMTGRPVRVEGKEQGDWVLIDTDDVIVHIFRPEVRDFYQLEKMWMPADALAELRQSAASAPQPGPAVSH